MKATCVFRHAQRVTSAIFYLDERVVLPLPLPPLRPDWPKGSDGEPKKSGLKTALAQRIHAQVTDLLETERQAREILVSVADDRGTILARYGQPGHPVPQWILDIVEPAIPRP